MTQLQRSGPEHLQRVEGIEAVIQSIGDCVVVADELGRLTLFNRAAEDLLGLGVTNASPDEWSSTYGVFLPDGRTYCPTEELPLARAIRGEQVDGVELVIGRPGERPIPILARARPIRDEEGNLRGGVVVFHDITEQKEAQEAIRRARDQLEIRVAQRTAALRESEARYHDLYDHAPAMLFSIDVSSTRIIRCNRTLLEFTGYCDEHVVGHEVFHLFHPDCRPALHRAINAFTETGEVKDVDLLLYGADGRTIDVSLTMSAVRDADGNIAYGRSMMRDLTEQRRAEEQIRRQQEELTHVARLSSMGEMAAGVGP